MNNQSCSGAGESGRAMDEEAGNETRQPPRGSVFQALGVMELENRWSTVHRTTEPLFDNVTSGDWDADDSSVESEGDSSVFEHADERHGGNDPARRVSDYLWNVENSILATLSGMGNNMANDESESIHQSVHDPSGATYPAKSSKKRLCIVAALMLSFAGIIAAVFTTTENYEDGTNSSKSAVSSETEDYLSTAPSAAHQGPIKIPSKEEDEFEFTGEKIDLSMYGYAHAQGKKAGWLSWPPEVNKQTFISYGAKDGVTSVEECAAKCQTAKAPTGAWNVEQESCWCTFVDVSHLCKEPCVTEEFIDFSTVPFAEFGHCEKSVCDKDWYHEEGYCEKVMFDEDACDAKIQALSQDRFDPSFVPGGGVSNRRYVEPSAMSTIKKSSPDSKSGAKVHFSVEGGGQDRISFIRFDLPVSGSEVSRATMHFYMVSHHKKSSDVETLRVNVDALPHAGHWSNDALSWNNWNDELQSKGSFFVGTFAAVPLDAGVEKRLYAVDVTSAILSTKSKHITLKLSTESSGRIDFAGKEWSGGEDAPKLMLTV